MSPRVSHNPTDQIAISKLLTTRAVWETLEAARATGLYGSTVLEVVQNALASWARDFAIDHSRADQQAYYAALNRIATTSYPEDETAADVARAAIDAARVRRGGDPANPSARRGQVRR